jgi:tRNA(Ile)-lysidine synthase
VEALVDSLPIAMLGAKRLRVPTRPLVETTAEGRAVLWAALFGRVGVAIDANGTRALVRFSDGDRIGAHLSLAGGATVIRSRVDGVDVFEVRGAGLTVLAPAVASTDAAPGLPPRWGRWRFREAWGTTSAAEQADEERARNVWHCAVPRHVQLTVRAWNPGDRICTAGARAGRRVTRYFAEAGVPALDRPGWPVVLQAEEIVWVPGVCRSVAAPSRPGRSDLSWYRCERERD